MALPITTAASEAFVRLRMVALQMQTLCTQLGAQLAAGVVYPDFLLMVAETSRATILECASLTQVPGLAVYAGTALGDPALDLHTLVAATLQALGGLQAAIIAEFPKDDQGRLLYQQFAADGAVQLIQVSAASLTQTQAAATGFLATVV